MYNSINLKSMLKFLLLMSMCFVFLSGEVRAQERSVTGKVTLGEDGSALPGVNVVIKGTATGTVTDAEGTYTLSVPSAESTLLFSFIGLISQEVLIGERTVVNVVMESDVKQLNEVVVTAVGIEREKKALGYSVQEVKNTELVKTRQTSVLNSLQGKVAGAQITSSGGGLGSSTRVVLRGPTSLLGNNQALFIVDGVPVNNQSAVNVQASGNIYDNNVDAGNRANDINPEDIESVSVLKGPAAAALYGSRAASGVILITTKKGTARNNRKNEVTFNSSYLWSRVYVLPKLQNKFGQGQFGDNQTYLEDQESWGDQFDGSLRPFGAIVNNTQQYKAYEGQPDNVKDFYDIGKTFQNSLSLNGGNDRSTYYLSFTDLAQTGVIPTTDYHRNNFTINGSTKLNNKLSSSASINYVRVIANLPQTGQANQAITQILNMPRDYSYVDFKDLQNPFNTPDGFFTPYAVNPYYTLEHDFSKQNLNRVYGNFQLSYDPFAWMAVTARVGTDVSADKRSTFHDIVFYNNPNGPNYQKAANFDGEYTEQAINTREINTDLIVRMTKKVNEKIEGNFLVGHNFNQRTAENLYGTANNLTTPGFANLGNVNGNYSALGTASKRRLLGVYSELDLSYDDFLFFGATYRNDWSSTLPKGNNSFGYPSVNVSFVPTDAFGFSNNILSFMKIRASYAEVGNDANVYLINSVFTQPLGGSFDYPTGNFAVIDFPFNNGIVSVPGFTDNNTIGNLNLEPERTKAFEIGTDIRLFNGRLNLDVAYYNSLSESQILTATIAPSSGYRNQTLNVGSVSNKGIEVSLGGSVIKTDNFRWDVNVNFAKNKNRVEELNEGATEIPLLAQDLTPGLKIVKGMPYGVFEATTVLRTADGKIVVDEQGLPVNDPNPVYRGSIQPDWTAGLTSSVDYKGFNLSVTFDTRQGGKIVSSTMAQLYFNGQAEETGFNNRDEFIIPNSVVQDGVDDQGQPIYVPNTSPLTIYDNTVRSYWANVQGGDRNEEVLLDASYIKLREVALNYSIPKAWLQHTPFGDITIGAIGRNLWLHSGKNNHFIDPEANAFGAGSMPGYTNLAGYEFYGVPTQASYGFNLRATF
jgi:TonB-linked SusC/RagA family outer membrane protein